MKFPSTLARLLWRGGFAAAVTALALAACGGGSRVEDFHPTRILAFGDEYSAFEPATAASAAESTASQVLISSRKYMANAYELNASGVAQSTFDCRSNPLWIQQVGAAFGLAFSECQGAVATARGFSLAASAAKVSDVALQVSRFLAGDATQVPRTPRAFGEQDIVTFMAGHNDILELFALYPAQTLDSLMEQARQRAKVLADQANQVAQKGPAVLVMRIPNLDLTPLGQAGSADARNALRKLTEAFNVALQLNLINDGHLIGLVYGDAEINNMRDFAPAYGLVNVNDAWCKQAYTGSTPPVLVLDPAPLLDCTNNAVASASPAASAASAAATTFLWSGATLLGPTGQARLGTIAADRAVNNPF
jgi:phospholipase/lecithinase/hemolysin